MFKIKKIFLFFMIAALLSATGLFPHKSEASVPVFETNVQLIGATTKSFIQDLYEWGQTFVLESLKKRVLDMMVDQIIGYIQGEGRPRFVTDWQGFLKDAGNAAAGDAAELAGLGFLCSPFNIQLQLALAPVPTFTQQVTCTLDQIVDNVQDFYDDFRNGGWLAFGETLRPQNNFYGAFLMARSAQQSAASEAASAAFAEGIASAGFLGEKKCDASGKNCRITTPGSILGDTVANAIGSDFDRIIGAQQVKEYVGAIADAAFNRLLREGAGGLLGVGTPSAPPQRSFSAATRGACAGLSGSLLQLCQTYARTTNNSFSLTVTAFIDQINDTVVPRQIAVGIINDSIALEENLILKLKELRDCTNIPTEDEQLQTEIDQAQATIDRLGSGITVNNVIIRSLLPYRDQIDGIPEGDWASLTITFNDASQFLDSNAASNFLADAQEENELTQPAVDRRIAELEREIKECRQTP